jgi:hypothetical protein
MATLYLTETAEWQVGRRPLLLSSTVTRSINSADRVQTSESTQVDDTMEERLSEYARQKGVPLIGRMSAAGELVKTIEKVNLNTLRQQLSHEFPNVIGQKENDSGVSRNNETENRAMSLIERSEFVEWYSRLGRWVGPFGTKEAQAELIDKWQETGEIGAVWLLGQLLNERHADAISGSSRVLLRMANLATPHIIAALSMSAHAEAVVPTVALLRILRDLDAESVSPWRMQISHLLQLLVDHFDRDVRLAAFHAYTDLFPIEEVRRVLAQRRAKETDPDLIAVLESFLH